MDTNDNEIQTKKENKMNNRKELEKHYEAQGYKYFGCVNYQQKALNAMSKSTNKQYHEIGRCLHLVALHDLKAYVIVDSGD